MATKIRINQSGIATGVYDDRLIPIYRALGVPVINRASEVEYDQAKQVWIAKDVHSGAVLAIDENRAECIKQEVQALERGI